MLISMHTHQEDLCFPNTSSEKTYTPSTVAMALSAAKSTKAVGQGTFLDLTACTPMAFTPHLRHPNAAAPFGAPAPEGQHCMSLLAIWCIHSSVRETTTGRFFRSAQCIRCITTEKAAFPEMPKQLRKIWL